MRRCPVERACFNPCCGGLVASTSIAERVRNAAASMVSILVVVDWSRQLRSASSVADVPSPRFQSLLWWIGRVNDGRAWSGTLDEPCFNPCCGGLVASTLRRSRSRSRLSAAVSILVVVDWSRQPGEVRPRSMVRRACFNPCCGGLVASTPAATYASLCRCLGFNPCCGGLVASTLTSRCTTAPSATESFNPCCGGLVASTAIADRSLESRGRFQSLLWWIGRVNSDGPADMRRAAISCFNPCCGGLVASTPEPVGQLVGHGRCFNPCCGGLVASTRPRSVGRCTVTDVSILVVVDWSRQQLAPRRIAGRLRMFQSLLWWIGRVNRSEPISYTTILSCNASTRARNSGRCDGNGLSVHMHG